MQHRVITASFHRNGIGGTGFYASTVESHVDGATRRFLLVDFRGSQEEGCTWDPGALAVLEMDRLAAGNVAMHALTDPDSGVTIEGTGGNGWRGADNWQDAADMARDWWHRSTERTAANNAQKRES